MDLYSGLPYWIAKNPLYNYFNPLKTDISTDVAIIGTGVTGALVMHELCTAGIKCVMVDKRSITTGSSIASTALLQYEIDTPLCEMMKIIGEDSAVKAYQSCLQSITDIENVFKNIDFNPDFERVPSVYYASNKKGQKLIEKEYEIRCKHKLPVSILNKEQLQEKYGIKASGCLENDASAQIDAYKAATHLIDFHMRNNNLEVFTHTEILGWDEHQKEYQLITTAGKKIRCKYAVIAAGFEAGRFLPQQVMNLTSTYAIISEPIDEKYIWYGKSLIWETKEPYLYIRTDGRNRIIVGGEDEGFKDPAKRDLLLKKKVSILEIKIKKLFPTIPFKTDMAWCGTFSSTKDGLPYIGNWPGGRRMFYALGYGGNGITFSMIAAQIIKNKLTGIKDEREKIFAFSRTEEE
ncbi:FAD-binding oxidoreductase [Dysgonomonas sp. Marseille-P4677]|uniref:NAD(P)/FAD-dependent oxidoreductase n=1 Tax=Dysgonomonas sp. Marseille-P4677 TaxID=2364790 RepID=UPI001914B8C2|nr:FAD-dependent oxidoreductase [Dysgonomonas sp. Marseille-P4677]MBK5722909.1 FAD-binding oxidoreductase [Dysgonomonas sp. Marseille-P4677]